MSYCVAWQKVCTSTKELGGLGTKDSGCPEYLSVIKAYPQTSFTGVLSLGTMGAPPCLYCYYERRPPWTPLGGVALSSAFVPSNHLSFYWQRCPEYLSVWHGDDALADKFPILFSHCILKELKAAASTMLVGSFVQRMSVQARQELDSVKEIIHSTPLSDQEDRRLSSFDLGGGKLHSAGLYRMIKSQNSLNDKDPVLPKFV